MSELSERAEQIAAHLVAHDTSAAVEQHDVNGRQGAVDFVLTRTDGDTGALEVTMITQSQSIAWQGMAMAVAHVVGVPPKRRELPIQARQTSGLASSCSV